MGGKVTDPTSSRRWNGVGELAFAQLQPRRDNVSLIVGGMAATKTDAQRVSRIPRPGMLFLQARPTPPPQCSGAPPSTSQLNGRCIRRRYQPSDLVEKRAVYASGTTMMPSAADDFERLPPALRRKYFSNLERLRLAQKSAPPPNFPNNGRLSRKASASKARPTLERRSTYLGWSPTRRLQKSESLRRDYLISQAEARWFESLPKKIQERHFTREEAVSILAGKKENIILDAADEALYRFGRHANPSNDSLQTMSTSNSRTSFAPGDEGSFQGQDHFRWLDDEDKLDLTLDDYHSHIARTALPAAPLPSPRKPSFRRALSLNSIAFGRNSSSSRLPPTSPLNSNPPTPTSPISPISPSHRRPMSSIVPPRSRHTPRTSISSIDPTAKHYRDPEARLKLRVYLASPQKFDEALEFGFPSLGNRDSASHSRPDLSTRRTNSSARDFLEDDSDSLFEDDNENVYKGEDDRSTIEETDSPLTPKDPVLRTSRSSRHGTSSESSSGPLRPRHISSRSGSYNHPHHHKVPTTVSREMTLHMTLTRPDLRTADDMYTSKHLEDDPLRLAELPSLDAGKTNIWDTMPTEGGVVRKMWRKLRNR